MFLFFWKFHNINALNDSVLSYQSTSPLSCWSRMYPAFANSVDPDQLASKKPTDLDLHCFPFNTWIYINNLDQVIWLAENLKRAGHLNLFSKTIIMKTCLFKYIENFTNKTWKFSDKSSDIFHISTQNIDCGYSLEPPWRGGSNEYPQSMFLSRNKKNNVYPCKPQFYYIKVGFKEVKII